MRLQEAPTLVFILADKQESQITCSRTWSLSKSVLALYRKVCFYWPLIFSSISIRKFSIECYLTIGNIFGHFPPSVSSSSSDDLGHHHSAEIRYDTALSGKGQWRKIYDSWLFLIFTMMSFEFRAFKGSNKAKIGLHSGAGNTQYVWDDRVWMVARSIPFCDTKIRWQCCWISFPDICPD